MFCFVGQWWMFCVNQWDSRERERERRKAIVRIFEVNCKSEKKLNESIEREARVDLENNIYYHRTTTTTIIIITLTTTRYQHTNPLCWMNQKKIIDAGLMDAAISLEH